jgi:16S rRNA (cytosine967-C5)-methyltransferase
VTRDLETMNAPADPRIQVADPREVAAEVVTDVLTRGRPLSAGLAEHVGAFEDPRDRAFARELSYGVARWLPRLQACLDLLMEKPLKEKDVAVRVVLLLGLYQLMYTRVPEHAAVTESVARVRRAGKPWAAGLVNGVLRSFLRRRAELTADLEDSVEGRLAHPAWLARLTADAWPEDWEQILQHNNERPPLALRVNGRRRTRQAYLADLADAGLAATPIAHTTYGVHLQVARDVEALPGFADGVVSVQDGAAQLAAGLLDVRPSMRVLDACAAPGGKSAHILETQPAAGELVAVDCDGDRIQRVMGNLERLGLAATVITADAGAPDAWWDGGVFQRILVDAPCSGTGVIRRNPDIKVQRRPGDVAALAAGQIRLLDALWPLLAPRGLLLYATCSYLPRENDHVLAEFLAKHPDAACSPMEHAWGRATRHGRQVLPGEDTMDGFYYALLGKH